MVDVAERTWAPDETARAEVLRRYLESCKAGAPLRGAEIAREMPGLKVRWTQAVIAAERKAQRAEAKAAKRTAAETAPQLPLAEEAARPMRDHTESARKSPKAGRGRGTVVAWGAFALGLLVSIASNIGHVVFVIGVDDPWLRLCSMGMAGLWPVLLAVAVEVVSRVAWPRSWRWWIPGYGATVLVGLIAFTISYQHLHGLLLAFGESFLTAMIGPLALDLTIVVAGVALLAIGEARKAATTTPEPSAPPVPYHTTTPVAAMLNAQA